MRTRFRVAGIAVGALVLGGLGWLAWQAKPPPPEPVLGGKPLSEWVMVSFRWGGLSGNEAIMRVEEAGTNAIPTLLRMESAHPPVLKLWLNTLELKLRFKTVKSVASNDVNNAALQVMQRLGPQAAGAVPELIRIYRARYSVSSQNVAAFSLAAIGPEAKAAVPWLLRETENTNIFVRNSAYFALGKIRTGPKEVVPVLVKGLKDPESMIAAHAAEALGEFGPDARETVPALVEFIKHERLSGPSSTYGSNARIAASKALRLIDPEAAAKLQDNAPAEN